MPKTIPEVVGAFLARFREQHQLTQEAIALQSRPFGTSWGASKIRRIEDGDAHLSLGDTVVLLEAMRRASRRPVTVKDVFPDDLTMVIGEVPITGSELRAVLRGDTPAWMEPRRIGFGIGHLLDGKPAPASLASKRAAKKLGISPQRLDELAFSRWMETFDEIVSHYAEGDSQQAKGHATRRVLLELSEALSNESVGAPVETPSPKPVPPLDELEQRRGRTAARSDEQIAANEGERETEQ